MALDSKTARRMGYSAAIALSVGLVTGYVFGSAKPSPEGIVGMRQGVSATHTRSEEQKAPSSEQPSEVTVNTVPMSPFEREMAERMHGQIGRQEIQPITCSEVRDSVRRILADRMEGIRETEERYDEAPPGTGRVVTTFDIARENGITLFQLRRDYHPRNASNPVTSEQEGPRSIPSGPMPCMRHCEIDMIGAALRPDHVALSGSSESITNEPVNCRVQITFRLAQHNYILSGTAR
jgi:hypothetical protein